MWNWIKKLFGKGDRKTKHKASFLFDNAGTRVMNILAHNVSNDTFNATLSRCIQNGDDTIYLYVGYNNGDGPGVTSFYVNDKFGGALDSNKMKLMLSRLKAVEKKGLYIVGWIFADDNGSKVPFKDTAALKACALEAASQFGKYVSEYVIALEADEYLSSAQVETLCAAVKKASGKSCGVHQKPGRYDLGSLPSVGKMYLQYGFGKDESYVDSLTKAALAATGKPVIAAEYHKSSDSAAAKSLGLAAIAAGASGTGNGRL